MLLRKFIGERLSSYYAQSADAVVSSPPPLLPIKFHQLLLGEWQWRQLLNRLYREQKGQWFTPVELFKPYYSNTVANFITTHCRTDNIETKLKHEPCAADGGTIEIVELGGGRGTNAVSVLDHLEQHQPDLYHRVQYLILDSSPTLHQLQKKRLRASSHADKVSFVLKDLLKVAEGQTQLLSPLLNNNNECSPSATFVIALEVFDNLPHDKVMGVELGQRDQRRGLAIEQRQQCTVKRRGSPMLEASPAATEAITTGISCEQLVVWDEHFETLSDPLLSKILRVAPNCYAPPNTVTWVPTVALALLHQLPKYRPQVQFLMADFDWFPDPSLLMSSTPGITTASGRSSEDRQRRSVWAEQEPLIKSMSDNEESDGIEYECYLTAPWLSDILFPTDFARMSKFLKNSWKHLDRDVVVRKQADFLLQYGPEEVHKTKSWLTGYTPMLHDYCNTSVLTATIPRRGSIDELTAPV